MEVDQGISGGAPVSEEATPINSLFHQLDFNFDKWEFSILGLTIHVMFLLENDTTFAIEDEEIVLYK